MNDRDESDHEESNALDNDEDLFDGHPPPGQDSQFEPTSHDDSPSIQSKRKHQDLETSSSSDSEVNNGHNNKAQKINNKAGRPRAGDYEDLAKELILQAATVYRCLLSTEDAFPDLATEAEMVKKAWGHVNREAGMTPLRLTPDIAKIVSGRLVLGAILTGIKIKARGSQARGEIKEKTKALVEGLFGFDSSHGRKAIVANRKWAEELKHEKGFIYKVLSLSFSFIDRFYLTVTIFRPFPSIWRQRTRNARGCTNIQSFRKPLTLCGSRTSGMKVFGIWICSNLFQLLQSHWF